MALLISKGGEKAIKVEKKRIKQEGLLQQFVDKNPEIIPISEVKEDVDILVVAREFTTPSGPLDALAVDSDGDIYIIETKLYKNPDKRKVLAQAIDYGAALWRKYEDPDDFIKSLEKVVMNTTGKDLTEILSRSFGRSVDEIAFLLDVIKLNLVDGNLKFVVLMDKADRRLKNLISFMNENTKFDIYAVELDYYEYEEYVILSPSLFGAGIKKNLEFRNTAESPARRMNRQIMQDVVNSLASELKNKKVFKEGFFFFQWKSSQAAHAKAYFGYSGTKLTLDARFESPVLTIRIDPNGKKHRDCLNEFWKTRLSTIKTPFEYVADSDTPVYYQKTLGESLTLNEKVSQITKESLKAANWITRAASMK